MDRDLMVDVRPVEIGAGPVAQRLQCLTLGVVELLRQSHWYRCDPDVGQHRLEPLVGCRVVRDHPLGELPDGRVRGALEDELRLLDLAVVGRVDDRGDVRIGEGGGRRLPVGPVLGTLGCAGTQASGERERGRKTGLGYAVESESVHHSPPGSRGNFVSGGQAAPAPDRARRCKSGARGGRIPSTSAVVEPATIP